MKLCKLAKSTTLTAASTSIGFVSRFIAAVRSNARKTWFRWWFSYCLASVWISYEQTIGNSTKIRGSDTSQMYPIWTHQHHIITSAPIYLFTFSVSSFYSLGKSLSFLFAILKIVRMLTGDLHLIKHPNMERETKKNPIVIDVTFLINRSKNIRYFNARCLFCDVFTMKFCYDWFRLGF